jgi:hypothetical protein
VQVKDLMGKAKAEPGGFAERCDRDQELRV